MKMTFTVSKSIALTLICVVLLSYGSTAQAQRRGRAPQKPVSKTAGLVDEAAKLADERKYAEAIEVYKLAIQNDPNYARAHGGLGDAYFDDGKWEQALAEYKEQIRLAPNDAQAHFALGYLYNFMGRHGEAFAPLVKATALDPTFGEAFYEIGYAYLRGDQFEKSIPFFKSAIRLIPDYSEAYYGLGLVYARLGKREIADEQLKKLNSLDPKLARKLEKDLGGPSETAEVERTSSEPPKQSTPATQPPVPATSTDNGLMSDHSSSQKNTQARNPSPSTSNTVVENRPLQPVRKRPQTRSSAKSSTPNSHPAVNKASTQFETTNLSNRERAGTTSPQAQQNPNSDGDWTEIIRRTMPGVVSILLYNDAGRPLGTGSGFVVGSDGIVVTNFHVIQGASRAQVITRQ